MNITKLPTAESLLARYKIACELKQPVNREKITECMLKWWKGISDTRMAIRFAETEGEWVEVFKPVNYGEVVIVSHEPKEVGYVVGYMTRSLERFPNDHPEHAHNSLPAGCYQWIQQLDTRTMKAVQD